MKSKASNLTSMDEFTQSQKAKLSFNVLFVSKDFSLYDAIKKSAMASQWNFLFARAEEDILSSVKRHRVHVVIAEIKKNKKRANLFLKRLKNFDSLLEVIFVGEPLPSEQVMDLINLGASDFLARPFELMTLEKTLKKIIKKRKLRRETFHLERELEKKFIFHGMIGKGPYMLEVFSLIEKISKYFKSVLITGETGTGKEMAARAIHDLSMNKNRKFIICDCVSIPDSLFESELFGYTKGAFTGADRNKKGLFEEADGGIIFLDEIGEIPQPIQAKLLRVLENRQFRPLGSNENRKVDVRIIAATSRNLREGIKSGNFREDLFHRLNKVEIHLPPLRERSEDIPPLVRHMLERYSAQFGKPLKGVSRQVQKLFQQYRWPGNVRELENVLERASMLCRKDFIDIEDLPKYLQDYVPSNDQIPFVEKARLSTLNELEKEYILYLLKKTNNNLRKTAKILNVSRTTLYNKIRKYSIEH